MSTPAEQPGTRDLISAGRNGLLRVLESFAQGLGHSEQHVIDAMREAVSRHHDELAGLLGKQGFEMAKGLTASRITLIDDETLDLALQLTNLERTFRERSDAVLPRLHMRYMRLLDRPSGSSEKTPLGPETVCRGLQALADAAAMDAPELKLLIDRAENELAGELDRFYKSLDKRLERLGVKPRALASSTQQRPYHSTLDETTESVVAEAASATAPQVDAFERLQQTIGRRQNQATSQSAPLPPELAASIVEQVRNWLSDQYRANPNGSSPLSSSQVAHLLPPENALAVEALEALLDFVARDDDLHPPIRTTLARLRIPLIKHALGDGQPFTDARHPGRRLIDAIAVAANTLPFERPEHPGFARIDALVSEMLEGDGGDIAFDALERHATRLEAWSADRRMRAVRDNDEAVIDLALRAEHRENARLFASRAMGILLDPRTPETIEHFLTTHWIQVLTRTLYKRGEKHPDWRDQLDAANQLVLSGHPTVGSQLAAGVADDLPALLIRIESGLAGIGLDATARQQALAPCREVYDALLAGQPLPRVATPQASQKRPATGLALSGASQFPHLRMLHHKGFQRTLPPLPETLGALELGSWLELDLKGTRNFHGCIAWIGPARKSLLIADPDGKQRLIATMRALADLHDEQRLRIMNPLPLTQRAAAAALKNLEDSAGPAS